MARIRTVKPEFFRHHKLYLAEVKSKLPLRIAFAGLWTASDREGRFKWDSEALKLDCLPYDKLDFSKVLDLLCLNGFLMKYEVDGRLYGCIPSFLDHQVINNREKPSSIPSPLEAGGSTRPSRDVDASLTRLNLDQVEGKGKEGKGIGREQEQRVVVAWNSSRGIVQIRKLDLKRTQSLRSRLEEKDWNWEAALKKFPLKCFSNGDGWIPNFDWFIKPGTVDRILEGKYDFHPSNGKKEKPDRLGEAPEIEQTPEQIERTKRLREYYAEHGKMPKGEDF
jgi:hypothetical protein